MQKFGYFYDTLWLPHDAENKTLAASGKSISEIVRNAGNKVSIIPKAPVFDSINAARTIFPNCWFDRENTADGINCLRHYRYDTDESGNFSRSPLHDEYSHGADAFRYIGLMVNEPKQARKKIKQTELVSWMG
jgi:phage terminase large subunit